MTEKIAFDPVFQTTLPLPLARLYARAHHAKGDRERHDHAFHLLEASLKLAASALVGAYRTSGRRSEKVDAALRSLALPSLGQWRSIFRETLAFLGSGPGADPWAGAIIERIGTAREGRDSGDLFAALAKAAEYAGRAIARPTALDLLDLLPTYRNAMSDAHGSIKADPEAYRESAPALLALAGLLLEGGAIFAGARLVYAEEVRVGLQGEKRVVWMDLAGPTAMRRQPYEGEETTEEILPGRLYLEIPTRGPLHLPLHPLIHYQPGEVLDQVFFLNRARLGKRGIQYLCYETGEFYLPGRDQLGDFLVGELKGLLSWVTEKEIGGKELEDLAARSRSDAQVEGEKVSEEEVEPTGTVLGDFEILGELGRGGMAVVYLARQMSLNRQVALKVLPPAFGGDPVALSRFKQEVRALSRCDHPNVVKILSSGEAQGTHYYAMEFIDGGDLGAIGKALRGYRSSGVEVLREEHFDQAASSQSSRPEGDRMAGLPEAEKLPQKPVEGLREGRNIAFRLAAAIRDAARGVHHIHEHGIVHRDLKPQNIMVTRSEHRPVVMDLGLAKMSEVSKSLTLDKGRILGTLRYMPPEQLQRNLLEVDARADVYALGAVLYELACLRPMLDGDSEERITAQILFEEPPPAQKVNPRIPTDLATIIAKATRKDPKERYGSAGELADDLDRFVHGEAVSAKPPTLGYLLKLFVRRHRAAVAIAVALVIVLVLGFVASTLFWLEAERARKDADASAAAAREAWVSEAGQRARAETERGEAEKAKLAAIKERQRAEFERDAKAKALTQAEGLYLTAQSSAVFPSNPGLSLLLAIEGTQRLPGLLANNALLAALGAIHEKKTLIGHKYDVVCVSFSPDGQRVVTGSADDTALIWDVATGMELLILRGHEGPIESASFSPDGRQVLTASYDSTARVWDASTGKELLILRGHAQEQGKWIPIRSASFSPDGRRVVTASDDTTARIWDASTGKDLLTLRGHEERLLSASFSPNGQRVVTSSMDETARIWDVATGKELFTLRGHKGGVFSASFSPDGLRLVTASQDDTARIWDAATGKELLTLRGHILGVGSASFSPDGQRVLTASDDRTARIWDASTGKELLTLRGHDGEVFSAWFSPDAQRVLTASVDRTARIWDAATAEEIVSLQGHSDEVRCASFSPDAHHVVTASLDNTARIWDAAKGKELITLFEDQCGVKSVSFSPDGQRVVLTVPALASPCLILDASTGRGLLTLRGQTYTYSASFSPDGQRIVTASNDRTARIWDASTGKELLILRGHQDSLDAASFSPDGHRVLTSSSRERTVRIWDTSTGKELLTLRGHQYSHDSSSFSPDGQRVVTGSADNTARIWDTSTGKELLTLRGPIGDPGSDWGVRSASFSPDGQRVVTSSGDRTARIWDASTGKELLILRGHEKEINCASFSPDAQRVLTCSWDRTARIWDAATGKELLTLRGHEGIVFSASFSPDGLRAVTASQDGTVRIWPVDPFTRALARKPRDLTPDEADQFQVGSPEERFAFRQRWVLSRALKSIALDARQFGAGGTNRYRVLRDLLRSAQEVLRLAAAIPDREEGDRSVKAVVDLLSTAGMDEPDLLELVAEAQTLQGRFRDAVLILERAVMLPGASASQFDKLAERRKALLPDLVTYPSIDDALTVSEAAVIPRGAEWRFFRGRTEPSGGSLAWTLPGFDDASWEKGPSGLGYEDGDDATVLDDMKGGYTTLYARHVFLVPDPSRFEKLQLSVHVDDGCVAYLNSREVLRVRAGKAGEPLRFDAVADSAAPEPLSPSEVSLGKDLLVQGANVLAIQGLNQSISSSDFSLIPVLEAEFVPDLERDRKRFEAFRAAAEKAGTADARARLHYLEARLLQRLERHADAVRELEGALASHPTGAEPHLRLAESLRRLGNPREAEARLGQALRLHPKELAGESSLWESWFAVSAVDLRKGAAEILASIPLDPGKAEGPGGDFRWVLEELRRSRALRINCGGAEHRSADGKVWAADRFYASGYRFFGDKSSGVKGPFTEEIANTDDDHLYQTERHFLAGSPGRARYKIPLPRGSYRVTLHFAELYHRVPGERIFDVLLEGERVLEGYEPLRVGFATAKAESFTVKVEDGFLEIDFVARAGNPKISAIEIEALGEGG